MDKRSAPALDSALSSRFAESRDGHPLSYNRAPSPDLSPWFTRIYVTIVDAPADHRLDCGLFCDTGNLRLQLRGEWTAMTGEGEMRLGRSALFCGPHTRLMPISVTGSFASIGAVMRPGIYRAPRSPSIGTYLDRLVPLTAFGGDVEAVLARFDVDTGAERLASALEEYLRLRFPPDSPRPDPVTLRFEELAYANPSANVGEFARECGIDRRRLERTVLRDFGMPPKQVLRRARALDMASHMIGVADEAEGDDMALRYYDQSHLIREFTDLFGMSPGQFLSRPRPIMTLNLESRQARRLEAMSRITPNAKRPWQR